MKKTIDNKIIRDVLKHELTREDAKEIVFKVYAAPLLTMLALLLADIFFWIIKPGPGMILPTLLLVVVFSWCFFVMYRASIKGRKVYADMVKKYGAANLAAQMSEYETEVFYVDEYFLESYSFITPDYLIINHAGIYPLSSICSFKLSRKIYNESAIDRQPVEARKTLRNLYQIQITLKDGKRVKLPISLYPEDSVEFTRILKGRLV